MDEYNSAVSLSPFTFFIHSEAARLSLYLGYCDRCHNGHGYAGIPIVVLVCVKDDFDS